MKVFFSALGAIFVLAGCIAQVDPRKVSSACTITNPADKEFGLPEYTICVEFEHNSEADADCNSEGGKPSKTCARNADLVCENIDIEGSQGDIHIYSTELAAEFHSTAETLEMDVCELFVAE